MSSFKDMVASDINRVFLNTEEQAELRTIIYDGETYADIPVLLTLIKEQDRKQLSADHVQGLHLVSATLYCNIEALRGKQPEKRGRLRINDREGGGGFFREFYIATSCCELGMVCLELEAIDE